MIILSNSVNAAVVYCIMLVRLLLGLWFLLDPLPFVVMCLFIALRSSFVPSSLINI